MSDWALDSILVVDETLQQRFLFDCKQKLTSKKKALELPCTSSDVAVVPLPGSPVKPNPGSPGSPAHVPSSGSPPQGPEVHGGPTGTQKKRGFLARVFGKKDSEYT